ncbi:MAG TPA: AAA family ATPase [candidate division Zixibacteria bacterium]|jgi:uridine kinase|nr:AAA family ATPase [candidate division Zixibacteria bacterium]
MTHRPIEIQMDGQRLPARAGEQVQSIFKRYPPKADLKVVAAKINQNLVGLDAPVRSSCRLKPVTYADREGTAVYRRSACLILYEAVKELYPRARVVVGQSLANGYYFDLAGEEPNPRTLSAIEERMRRITDEDRPFVKEWMSIEEAVEYFQAESHEDKIKLLTTTRVTEVRLVGCGVFKDILHGPVVPSTGFIDRFQLTAYPPGFVLRFPRPGRTDRIPQLSPQNKLFQIYKETKDWNRILGVTEVGQLNELSLSGQIGELIRIAEGFHEKRIAQIADEITGQRDRVRLVLIAGPSSSGKTTFSKRLMIQLRVNGLRPIAISTDNYFLGRDQTPPGENGQPDFEALSAVDVPLFNRQMLDLLDGQPVDTPVYNFHTGQRDDRTNPLRLGPDDILLVEGIHGLNPRLTASVPPGQKLRVYISALTQLCLDDHNRIMTSDVRLIRRIVRDRRFRGYSAAHTLRVWPLVQRGEERNIFPYQEEADTMINSSLLYEPAVLRTYAERFLLEVPTDDESFGEAYRILHFLRMFVPVFADEVPHNSILREFIGGSGFEY